MFLNSAISLQLTKELMKHNDGNAQLIGMIKKAHQDHLKCKKPEKESKFGATINHDSQVYFKLLILNWTS